jgi:hypothetical protein
MKKMNLKNDVVRGANFIVALLMIYYFVFGVIANVYYKTAVGDNLLFLYLNFFNAQAWYTLLILIAITTFHAFREQFLVYAIKYNFWLVIGTILLSWIWYCINFQVFITTPIMLYFNSVNGLLNFLVLVGINFGTSLLGGFLRVKYYESIKKKQLVV